MQSTHSIETQNTIDNFFKRETNGVVKKTQKVIDWEQNRVDKVRRVRDKAVQLAMERTAKQILHDKKLEKNEKRFHGQLKDEAAFRQQRFESEASRRQTAKEIFENNNNKKD